jgi:hypothetical protein
MMPAIVRGRNLLMSGPETRTLAVSLLLACGLLGSCARSIQSAHTVDWYLAHPADRRALMHRCANDPGTLRHRPDCINARAAAARAGIGSLRNLPPMGLLGGKTGNTRARPGQSGER